MITEFLQQLVGLTLEIAPLLLLGMAIAGVLHVLVTEEQVFRHLGRPGWLTVIRATLFAVPLPLCSCSVVPVVASLRRKGATDGASVSFLIAAPQIGADSFFLTQGLMGLPFALYRIVVSGVTALVAGLLVDVGSVKRPSAKVEMAPRPATWSAPVEFWRHVQELVGSLANNLIIGLLVAALILVLLPDGSLTEWQGQSPWISMLAMLAIGIPLYVCATASTPIAAALVAKGLFPGAALVFLLAGPATNMVTLVLMRSSLGWRALGIYLGSIAGVALAAGWLLGRFWPGMDLAVGHQHQHGVAVDWLNLGGVLLLSALMINHYVTVFRHRWAMTTRPGPGRASTVRTVDFVVEGMTCTHCVGRVEQALRQTGLVDGLLIDLPSGMVNVTTTGDPRSTELMSTLVGAVIAAGYTVPPATITNN